MLARRIRWETLSAGAAALSLRAIAAQIGITAPAIYRYYPNRDALVTSLIVDAFAALGAAIRAATDGPAGEPHGRRLMAGFRAYRQWALDDPAEFSLLFGTPIPGYHAPPEATIPAARRAFEALLAVPLAVWKAGGLGSEEGDGQAALGEPHPGSPLPRHVFDQLIEGWGTCHGLVSLEMTGRLGPTTGDAAAAYQRAIREIVQRIGLPLVPRSPIAAHGAGHDKTRARLAPLFRPRLRNFAKKITMHVVLGASGGAGSAIVRALVARGEPVRAVTRSGKPSPDVRDRSAGAAWVASDARDADELRAATAGAAVIYHAVNVPYPDWPAALPAVMDAAIAAAAASGARLVYVDNLYMYGPISGPMREDLPAAASTKKGRLRARLANRLLAAHARGEVAATIGRCSDFFGPGVTASAAGPDLFCAILRGNPARWFGDLEQPHALTFIDDAAEGFVTLGRDARSLGEVWHLPAAPALTGREVIAMASEIAGTPARPRRVPPWAIRAAGLVDPMAREFAELTSQFARPFVVDSTRFTATFGGTATPLRDALARWLAWYEAHPTAG